jgi:hypothetical protein
MAQYYDGYSSLTTASGDSYSTLDEYYDALNVPATSELFYLASADTLPYLNFTREFNTKVPTMRAQDYDLLTDGKYQVAEAPDYSTLPMELKTSWHNPSMSTALGIQPYHVPMTSRSFSAPQLTKAQKMKLDKLRKKMMSKRK